jgi:uncharacterized membrane protein
MSLALFVKFLHVVSAILFVAGIIGRAATYRQSARAGEIHATYSLLQASEFFERRLVIPGSMAVLFTGVLLALIQGWPMFGFLQNARTNWLLISIVLFLATVPAIPLYLIPRRKQRAQAAEGIGRCDSDRPSDGDQAFLTFFSRCSWIKRYEYRHPPSRRDGHLGRRQRPARRAYSLLGLRRAQCSHPVAG